MRTRTVAITERLIAEMRSEAKWRASKGPDKTAEQIAEQVMQDVGLNTAENVSNERYAKIKEQLIKEIS